MLFHSPSTCPHNLATRLRFQHLLSPLSRPSSTSSKFPFPSGRNASPHQIFHLPKGASQEQIKARYYDLVKLYHPDSALARTISSEQRNVRFQAITTAYDILRGRVPDLRRASASPHQSTDDIIRAELRRRRPAKQRHGNTAPPGMWGDDAEGDRGDAASTGMGASASDVGQAPRMMRWDEVLRYASFAVVAIVVVGAMSSQSYHARIDSHKNAAANLAQARSEAQEFGIERRRRIRERVMEARALEEARRTEELVGSQDHRPVDDRSSSPP